jgi:hypothetical protein
MRSLSYGAGADLRGWHGFLVAGAAVCLFGLSAVHAQASPTVNSDGDSASIDTFQSVDTNNDRSRSKDGQDFVGFSENLIPPKLTGIPGTAEAFVSQASTIVTADFAPPFAIHGIGVSGRLTAKSQKSNNGAAYVPFASPEGSFSADFDSPDPIPVQFAGSMVAASTDPDDCTEIRVQLSGGAVDHTFVAGGGGDCGPGERPSKGFVVEDTLPAGAYTLSVDYGTTVDPEVPGRTDQASGAVDVSLGFFPPDTKITSAVIHSAQGKAKFGFKATGDAHKVQCALIRGHKKPKFKRCSSPKTFRNLDPGKYKFEARAVGRVAPDATPAKKKFTIG